MKLIPILFSTPMVQAEREGRKTNTRRVRGLDEINSSPDIFEYRGLLKNSTNIHVFARMWKGNHVETKHIKCPYGQPDDVLWVRESFNWDWKNCPERKEKFYFYKATTNDDFLASGEKWKPSIHMPYTACRTWLLNKSVRPERLHDIAEEDTIAEGAEERSHRCGGFGYYEGGGEIWDCDCQGWNKSPMQMGFQDLWKSINGEESWNANPWVWRVEFERTEKP